MKINHCHPLQSGLIFEMLSSSDATIYQLALHRNENQGTVLQPENLNASKTKLSMLVKRREYHFDINDEFKVFLRIKERTQW